MGHMPSSPEHSNGTCAAIPSESRLRGVGTPGLLTFSNGPPSPCTAITCRRSSRREGRRSSTPSHTGRTARSTQWFSPTTSTLRSAAHRGATTAEELRRCFLEELSERQPEDSCKGQKLPP